MSFIGNIKSRLASFVDKFKSHLGGLQKKHYYIICGVVAAVIVLIVLLVVLSGFPAERFGDDYHYGDVAHIVFNKDGSLLASAEVNQQARVMVWDTSSRTLLKRVDGNAYDSRMIAFAEDDRVVVTAGDDETVRFWDIKTGSQRPELKVSFSTRAALSPDGRWLAYHKGTLTEVWELNFRKKDSAFEAEASSSKAMAFSLDSKLLATGDRNGVLRIYELAGKGLKVPPWQAHKTRITCVVFSGDSKVIGTASDDKTARLWDTEGEEQAVFKGHEQAVEVITIGPGARLVLTGSGDSTARLWDGGSGKELFKFENFRGGAEGKLAICADGSLAAIELTGGGIEVFETESGHSEVRFDVPVSAFAFAPAEATLYLGRPNGMLYTWKKGME